MKRRFKDIVNWDKVSGFEAKARDVIANRERYDREFEEKLAMITRFERYSSSTRGEVITAVQAKAMLPDTESPHRMFRGYKDLNTDYLYMEPSRHDRRSAWTSNYYTTWMDNRPEWSAFPKRSKSIVCSKSLGHAEGFADQDVGGATYAVVPCNENAKIGVCPKKDIWESFDYLVTDAPFFMTDYLDENENPYRILEYFFKQLKSRGVPDDNIDLMTEGLRQLECLDYFEAVFRPDNPGFVFSITTYGELDTYGDNEVWTSDDCVLINTRLTGDDSLSFLD